MAVLDAVGKIAERNEMALHDVRAAAQRLGIRVRARGSHSGNFDIFRNSSRHLVAGADLYAHYPNETRDRFKYSPTFALFFAPLSYVPWGLALLLWQLLNALALFYALTRLLPDKTADLAIAFVSLEVWRSMQNSQSNALVAATIILAFVALEKRKEVAAATWIVLG